MSGKVGALVPVSFRVGAIRAVRDYIDRVLAGGLKYDMFFALAAFFSALGLFVDAYAHSQGMAPEEGWRSDYHYWLAGGFGAVVLMLAATARANWDRAPRSRSSEPTSGPFLGMRQLGSRVLPLGYDVTLLGAAIYFAAMIGDVAWHQVFGNDRNVEALFSPSHLGLLVGAAIFRTGPLRAAYLSDDPVYVGWRGLWPAVMSATYLLFSLMVFTMYVSPFGLTAAARSFASLGAGPSVTSDMTQLLDWVLIVGVSGIFLHATIVMAIVLLLVERWGRRLPRGVFTFMFTATAAAIGVIRADCTPYTINRCDQFLATGILPLVVVAFVTGVAADLLLHTLAPSEATPWRFRLYAVSVPVILYLLYFIAVQDTAGGAWWSAQVWMSMILIPGALGYVMSFLLLQPPSKGQAPLASAPVAGGATTG